MPDSPDFSKYLPGSTRFSLQDMGELAARLDSPILYDRRGEVIWYDTFDNGLGGWSTLAEGTGASISLSADNIFKNPYACKLVAGTTGNRRAQIEKTLGSADVLSPGIENAIALTTDFETFIMQCIYHLPTGSQTVQLVLNNLTNKIQVHSTGGLYTDVATLSNLYDGHTGFNMIKLVWNLSNNYYARFLFNQQEIDLGDIPIYVTDDEPGNSLTVLSYLGGKATINATAYLAHIIATANEP